MTLRLYGVATNPEGIDVDTIVSYMSNQEDFHLPSTQALHGKSPARARNWALTFVEEVVEDRVREHVWPLPVRDYNGDLYDYGGHEQGWAFDSLLGAMWLQMMWLMLGRARRCEWCGNLLDIDTEQSFESAADSSIDGKRKPRSDRRFCPNNGRCKAKWNYHRGARTSSKEARRKHRKS